MVMVVMPQQSLISWKVLKGVIKRIPVVEQPDDNLFTEQADASKNIIIELVEVVVSPDCY